MYHVPILLNEICDFLVFDTNGIYVDATLGGGGHTEGILSRLTKGRLISIDLDIDALTNAEPLQKKYANLTLVEGNYQDIDSHLDKLGIDKISGCLLDLGISSYQIDTASRGFSYMKEGDLDMRMSQTQQLSAFDVVNKYSLEELVKIFFEYGEEKYSKKIAQKILAKRQDSPIKTTKELADLICNSVPYDKSGHPAKRVFQAIRIEVNNELAPLQATIEAFVNRLERGGRIAILSFHSLEDRIVKQVFKKYATDCLCNKNIPICVCGHKAELKLGQMILPSEQEKKANLRASSAKLRTATKI